MWAHYASQFTGICVGYSLSRLLKNLGDDVRFVRMYYSEKVPTVHRPHMEVSLLAIFCVSAHGRIRRASLPVMLSDPPFLELTIARESVSQIGIAE